VCCVLCCVLCVVCCVVLIFYSLYDIFSITLYLTLTITIPHPHIHNRGQLLTFSFQHALPRLPVPSLDHTVTKFMKTVQPLLRFCNFFFVHFLILLTFSIFLKSLPSSSSSSSSSSPSPSSSSSSSSPHPHPTALKNMQNSTNSKQHFSHNKHPNSNNT
jgi:hypothetical protein